jgi:hypothetical protein
MKKLVFAVGVFILMVLVSSLVLLHAFIGKDVKQNISMAKSLYEGNAEDALIAFFQDDDNTAIQKTHLAVWTLGQIRSEKALPILKKMYMNDPEGETCYGRHHEVICQYELHKAIQAIEHRRLFSYARLNR